MKHLFLLSPALCLMCAAQLFGQGKASLSPAEDSILSVISRDTLSSTVVYFAREIGFGIKDRESRYLVLLKQGKDNYFLMEGTNRVYRLENGKDGFTFVRQDKTTHEGDNLLMMAFMRRDTLFQYGGYGFWKVRDFFTYYAPGIREWEFLGGGQPMESMISWNYYDPGADRFYLIGRQTKNPHVGENVFIYDSVYAYDFTRRQFTVLGRITALDWKNEYKLHLGTMATTSFGLFMGWARQLKLVDCGKNRIYEVTGLKRDTIDRAFRVFDQHGSEYAILYLRDTVYWISGDRKTATVQKMGLVKADFDTISGTPLYNPGIAQSHQSVQASTSPGMKYPWVLLLVLGASAAAFLAGKGILRMRHVGTPTFSASPGTTGGAIPADPVTAAPRQDDDVMGFFLKHLTPVEAELLREMVRYSLQDRKMETDAINKILGVYNKDPEIQKARRSNAITHINNTFTQTTRRNGLLIQRVRDEFDKRVYVYFIQPDLVKFVSGGWADLRES